MRIFHGFDNLPAFRRPSATVGSYDGVHGGHRMLLDRVIRTAHDQGGESIVITFEPHPRITLGCADGLRLLTTLREKARLLEQAGIENLIVIPFDAAFSRLTPNQFVHDCLIRRVGVKNLVVGYNHRFGRDKEGNYDYLDRLQSQSDGLHVLRVAEYDPDSEKVSSTVLRQLIAKGEMAHAARILTHPYLVIGEAAGAAIHIAEPLKLLPPQGIYPVRANGLEALLTIGADQTMYVNRDLPQGEAVLTFEP